MKNENEKENFPITLIPTEKELIIQAGDREKVEKIFEQKNGLMPILSSVSEIARNQISDVSTKNGIAQIKSMAYKISGVKSSLDALGKEIVSDLKERPKKIDASRKFMREYLDNLKAEIRQPVTEIETREKEADHFLEIASGYELASSEEIKKIISSIEKEDLSEERWKETSTRALTNVATAINNLQALYDAAAKKENDARELEKLRKENEHLRLEKEKKRIADEAAARAKQEAEKKASAELEAANLRERNAREKLERANKKVLELQTNSAKNQTPQNTEPPAAPVVIGLPDAEKKESKWSPKVVDDRDEKRHRKICNREAADDLGRVILDAGEMDVTHAIIIGILKGKIRHIRMDYES